MNDHAVALPPAARSTEPGVPQRGPLLILSPHLDDAALSCSALLDRREPAEVLSVFTGEPREPVRTEWDQRTGFSDSAESMAARREEERNAFAGSTHAIRALGLLDIQYVTGPRPPADSDAIRRAVAEWGAGIERGTIAAPAVAGNRSPRWRARIEKRRRSSAALVPHPDHETVLEAALHVIAELTHLDLLLYEELPYAFGGPADERVSLAAERAERPATPIVAAISCDAKARRVAAYGSQISVLSETTGRLDDPQRLPAFERYWLLAATTEG